MIQINIISGARKDFTTTYTIADDTKRWKIPFSNKASWSLQVIWAGLTGTKDSTVKVQTTEDGENWDNLAGPYSKLLNTAAGSHRFRKDNFDGPEFAIYFERNTVDKKGTIKLLLTIKPYQNG